MSTTARQTSRSANARLNAAVLLDLVPAAWLFVVAFGIERAAPGVTVSNLTAAALLGLLAAARATGAGRREWSAWAAALIGLWTAAAPWTLAADALVAAPAWAVASNVLAGLAAVCLAAWSVVAAQEAASLQIDDASADTAARIAGSIGTAVAEHPIAKAA